MKSLKHRYVPKVEQVIKSWSDSKAPDGYFQTIGNIAYVIGSCLKNDSTIRVHQTKEKFGGVRVYCGFADEEIARDLLKLSLYPGAISSFRDLSEMPFDEFIKKRVFDDAEHYRLTYMMAFDLWPQYYNAIRDSADFPGLLCQTKEELDELLSSEFYSGCGFYLKVPRNLERLYKLCNFV